MFFASSDWKPPRPWQALVARLAGDGELWGLLAFGAACLAILATDRVARYRAAGLLRRDGRHVFSTLPAEAPAAARLLSGRQPAAPIMAIVFAAGPRSFGKRRAWADSAFGRRVALVVVGALVVWRSGDLAFQREFSFISQRCR